MGKTYVVVATGIMGGIVALTTSFLGVTGTIIGGVLAAIIMEFSSQFFKQPLESKNINLLEERIIYIIPLIIIILIESIYMLHLMEYGFIFRFLEEITNQNLFRVMGIALIILGLYPLAERKKIKWIHGIIIVFVGIFILIWGLVDSDIDLISKLGPVFVEYKFYFSLIIIFILSIITISIFIQSMEFYFKHKTDKFSDNSISNGSMSKINSISDDNCNNDGNKNNNIPKNNSLNNVISSNVSEKEEKILKNSFIHKKD
ncbi:hypothetical protein [Methanobrevibacter curvatus]|uniref:Uncharacterized protein n=1 Tax=Methanobrevibacter curvatus TaxID=49547 RepID=A0A165YY54_9EURY|nr:hypothetical protein [Methanobrevibacter curvatus]KZX10012.1 hypothetical protein MBCUR_19700 [Methanobrevibacter curvatus]